MGAPSETDYVQLDDDKITSQRALSIATQSNGTRKSTPSTRGSPSTDLTLSAAASMYGLLRVLLLDCWGDEHSNNIFYAR
jgi:hypothetical protein